MAVRLSALRAGRPLQPGIFLVLISVRGWVDSKTIMRLEGLGKLQNAIKLGTEPATLRFVAQCFNQLRYRVPPNLTFGRLNNISRGIHQSVPILTKSRNLFKTNIQSFRVPAAASETLRFTSVPRHDSVRRKATTYTGQHKHPCLE
jgi:hypothetical protein